MDPDDERQKLLSEETMRSSKFSTVDLHLPANWIGSTLQGREKQAFLHLRKKIDLYNIESVSTENLMKVLDEMEQIKSVGYEHAVPVLSDAVNYLRSLLLSTDTDLVFHTVILLDCMVKNSGFIVHVLIGRRKFMKTLSLVARRLLAGNTQEQRRVGVYTLDCLQAWGEAFYPREEYYPHIYQTYLKLRTKYHIRFPRPDFDPTRVPIFLGPVTQAEKTVAGRVNRAPAMHYGGVRSDVGKDEDAETAEAIARSLADMPVPTDKINYAQMEKFSDGRYRRVRAEAGPLSPDSEAGSEKDLMEAIQASLMETDLIDLKGAAFEEDTVPSSAPPAFSGHDWPRTSPVSGWSAFPDAPGSNTASKLSPEERILSLYDTSPARPPKTSPTLSANPFSWASPPATKPAAMVTPAPAWSPPLNPFDVYDTPARTTPVVGGKKPPPPPPLGGGKGSGVWDLDGDWDLQQLATNIKPKPTPRPDVPVVHIGASALPPSTIVSASAPAVSGIKSGMKDPEDVPSFQRAVKPFPSLPDKPPSLPPALPAGPPPTMAPPPPPPPPSASPLKQSLVHSGEEAAAAPSSPLPSYPPPPPPPRPPKPMPIPVTAGVEALAPLADPGQDPERSFIESAERPAESAEDFVLIDALQAMSAASPTSTSTETEHTTGLPLLSPPRPGPMRSTWRAARAPAESPGDPLQLAIQQAKAVLTRVELRPKPIDTSAGGSSDSSQTVVFERFDPTAGPVPVVQAKKSPPAKKATFEQPSSDPHAEIRFYGQQRVVVRRPPGAGSK